MKFHQFGGTKQMSAALQMSKKKIKNNNIITIYNNSDIKTVNNDKEMGGTLFPTKIAHCTLKCKKIFYRNHVQANASSYMLGGVCFLFVCTILSDV